MFRFGGPEWYEICGGSEIGGPGGVDENDGEGGVRSGRRPLARRAQQPHHRRCFLRRPGLQARCHRSFHAMEGGLGSKITSWNWPHNRIFCRCHIATEFSEIQWKPVNAVIQGFSTEFSNSVFSVLSLPVSILRHCCCCNLFCASAFSNAMKKYYCTSTHYLFTLLYISPPTNCVNDLQQVLL